MTNQTRPTSASALRQLVLWAGLVAAAALWFSPAPQTGSPEGAAGLSSEAKALAVVFVVTLTLWVTEAVPVAVTSLATIALLSLLGVTDTRAAIASFVGPVFIFVLATFLIAGVINHVGLDRRFARLLLLKAGTNPRRVLLAFMVGTGALSTFISDVPACAVFMALGLGVLKRIEAVPGESAFGRALMMGIPIAALIGGVATPAGSSVNVLGLDQIHDFSDRHGLAIRISFLQWMAIGIPMVLVLIPAAWWIILRCNPPDVDMIPPDRGDGVEPGRQEPLTRDQIIVTAVLATMGVLWIAGTWIPRLDVTLVAVIGAVVFFLPGVRLMDWQQAERFVGWNTLLMIGGVTALGRASLETGLARWLVSGVLADVGQWPLVSILGLICGVTVLIHLPLPIAPVVNAVLIPPVAELALDPQTGQMLHHPAMFALPVAFTASCAFLLPLDAVPLLTYSQGYYRMFDMLLPGTLISLLWVIVMTILMLTIAPAVGLTEPPVMTS